MERFDKILKDSITRQARKERSLDCPSEIILSEYLDGNLKAEESKKIESHLAGCLFCQEILVLAQNVIDYQNQLKRRDIYKKIFRQRWLILASVSFILSFFFSRYFLQFLFATLILGAKWVLSPEGVKNLVMIFRSFQKEEEKIYKEIERK